MSNDLPRKPGRPPNSVPRNPEVEAQIPAAFDDRHVPPMNCPKCGAFIRPEVERWIEKSPDHGPYAMCICTAPKFQRTRHDACRFTYRPALVRVRE